MLSAEGLNAVTCSRFSGCQLLEGIRPIAAKGRGAALLRFAHGQLAGELSVSPVRPEGSSMVETKEDGSGEAFRTLIFGGIKAPQQLDCPAWKINEFHLRFARLCAESRNVDKFKEYFRYPLLIDPENCPLGRNHQRGYLYPKRDGLQERCRLLDPKH